MRKIFFVVFICCTAILQAQYRTPYFNMLSVENGLPQASVNFRFQDKLGYLWLGTANGLVRYDGYRLKEYPILNEEGLPVKPASINQVFEDSKGELWIIVNLQGIYQLDRKRDVFVRIPFGSKDDDLIKNKSPNSLKYDKSQNIFWGVAYDTERDRAILYGIDLANKKMQVYSDLEKDNHSIPAARNIDISIDPVGKIWMLTDSLLSYFEPASKSFKPFFTLPILSGVKRLISVRADPLDKEIVWLNTTSSIDPNQPPVNEIRGLIQLNTKTKKITVSLPGSKASGALPLNCFHTFTDSLKRFWVSTEKGIALYDPKKGTLPSMPSVTQIKKRIPNILLLIKREIYG